MTIDDLIAIEEIKKLKSKYLRFMDQRRWNEWQDLFIEEATIRVTRSDQEVCFWKGKYELVTQNSYMQAKSKSIHHGVMPDIDIVSETTAKAAWMLDDTIIKEEATHHAYGYYDDEYVKVNGEWKIKSIACHLYPGVNHPS